MDTDNVLLGPGVILLRLLGLWPRTRLDRLKTTFTLVCILLIPLSVALKFYKDPPDELEDMTLCGFVAFISTGMLVKAGMFVVQGGTLRELVQLLSDTKMEHKCLGRVQDTREHYQFLSLRAYKYLQMAVGPSLVGWLFSPLVAVAVHKLTADPGPLPRQLIIPLWLPVDLRAAPTYELLYLFQAVLLLVAVGSSVALDTIFIHLMLIISGEMQVLCNNNVALEEIHSEKSGPKAEDNYSAFEKSASVDVCNSQMYSLFVENIRHHHKIRRAVSLLEVSMEISIFILLFINMANLCSSLYITSVVLQRDGNLSKIMKTLSAIPPVLYQTGLFCIFGQIVTDQSEKIINSAFDCGWAEYDTRFKRSLLIFMIASMRPLELTIGKTAKLSKEMLVQVLNGTYALLNMLYHFHSSA